MYDAKLATAVIHKMKSSYAETMRLLDDEQVQDEIADLISSYNISASAKYTLDPRMDFIQKIMRLAFMYTKHALDCECTFCEPKQIRN